MRNKQPGKPARSSCLTKMGNTTSTPKHLQRSDKTKSVIFTFEDYTNDAPDEEKIGHEVGALQTAISEHVRDYYHDRQIQRSPEDIEKALLREREGFPTLSNIEVSHLLCDIRTRRSALTSFISHMVIKNISFFGHKTHTLLSPGAVGCINEFGFGDPQVILTEGTFHKTHPIPGVDMHRRRRNRFHTMASSDCTPLSKNSEAAKGLSKCPNRSACQSH